MSSPDSPETAPVAEADDGVDRELRAARRTLVFFVVALGAAAAGLVMVLVGNRGDDGGSTVAEVPAAGESDVDATSIGPSDGDSVDRYLDDRRSAVEGVEGQVAAVVSLTGYASVETVEDLVDGFEVDRYLIAVVGDIPRATRDVSATVDDVLATAADEATEIESLLPTVEDDPEYSRFYREEIERYGRLLADADDDVVFGFVVVGRASDLRALASRASVRLVDVAAIDGLDADAEIADVEARGLRPEETATVGVPRFRP